MIQKTTNFTVIKKNEENETETGTQIQYNLPCTLQIHTPYTT